MRKFNILLVAIISLIITSCSNIGDGSISKATKAPSNYKGYYKVGSPYTVLGKTYYPKEYTSYKEKGFASWYGDYFHGKKTANGEIYNMNDFTAAHNTLPLPSIVKVTNLDNSKVVIVRVNDRGPFVGKGRIIDLSRGASQALGFTKKGVTKVEVELLKKETAELHRALGFK